MGIQEMPEKALVGAVEDAGVVLDYLQGRQEKLSEARLRAQELERDDEEAFFNARLAAVDQAMSRAMRVKAVLHDLLDKAEG